MIEKISRLARAIVVACVLFTPGSLLAQTGSATTAPVKKALPPGFEPVSGGAPTEQLDPNPLVVGAYIMFFVMMFGYMIYVARKQSEISKEMVELAERIKKAEKR